MENQLITTTQAVDPVFKALLGICLALIVGITAAMILFVVRYRRSKSPEPTSEVDQNVWLEVVWTAVPTLLVMGMFYYGWSGYLTLRDVPKNALQVRAVARMWSWNFIYENGRNSDKLYVPVGRPVQVNLESVDVLHAFYMPAFRVKRDAVPGMKNHVWFVATEPGSYDIFCAEYCGVAHAAMITTAEALPPDQFLAWLAGDGEKGEKEGKEGEEVLQKYGCLGCHSLDGTAKAGPTFKGLYGSQVKVIKEGKPAVVTADDAFLRESIVNPGATIVEGYPPIMPPSSLSEEEMEELLEFLKEVK